MLKLTPQLLKELEGIFEEIGYTVRYEKGNFRSGYCLLESRRIVLLNKYTVLESRIMTLMDILQHLTKDQEPESGKYKAFRDKYLKDQVSDPVKEVV